MQALGSGQRLQVMAFNRIAVRDSDIPLNFFSSSLAPSHLSILSSLITTSCTVYLSFVSISLYNFLSHYYNKKQRKHFSLDNSAFNF